MSARLIFMILMTVWAGIIIGVSLIATPVKFQAPSLTISTGVEIGRYTFRLLARIELCFLIAVIITAGIAHVQSITIAVLGLIVVEMVLQRFWLLPVLDNYVSQILVGGLPSFSIHHRIYAVMEAVKAALLIVGSALEYHSSLG